MSPCTQIIDIVVHVGTLMVLILTLCFAYKAYIATQALNQPLCAVKSLKIEEVKDRPNIYYMTAVITNTGNYVGENASIKWETYVYENNGDIAVVKGKLIKDVTLNQITLLPRHEIETGAYIEKKDVENNINWNKKILVINISIEYRDQTNQENKRYSAIYTVSRLLPSPHPLTVALVKSSFEILKPIS